MTFWDDVKFFTPDEFACKCGCGTNKMKQSFVLSLDDLRGFCGFPLVVTSGYRCPDYNNSISSTGYEGPHTTGMAVDFGVYGEQAFILLSHARRIGITGIGVSQASSLPYSKRFVHLDALSANDNRPRPWIWTY